MGIFIEEGIEQGNWFCVRFWDGAFPLLKREEKTTKTQRNFLNFVSLWVFFLKKKCWALSKSFFSKPGTELLILVDAEPLFKFHTINWICDNFLCKINFCYGLGEMGGILSKV